MRSSSAFGSCGLSRSRITSRTCAPRFAGPATDSPSPGCSSGASYSLYFPGGNLMTAQQHSEGGHSRRDFLKTTAAAAAVTTLSLAPSVHAAGSDVIKVGIIGCGGRGRGAGENVLQAAKGVEI